MSMRISIVSPEKVLFEGEAQSVRLPGKKSAFAVLKDHAPLVSELTAGFITVQLPDNTSLNYIVDGGFAEVGHNKVIALVDYAILPQDVNIEKEKKHLADLTAKVVSPEQAVSHARELDLTRVKIRSEAV